MTTTIGKSFQVYRLDRLSVSMVSRQTSENISSIQCRGHETYVAVGKRIMVFKRTVIVRTYDFHSCKVIGLVTVGKILLSYDEENNINVIDTKSRNLVSKISLIEKAQITAFIHPSTYINKFLLGFANGQLELWNINKRKLVYTFTSHLNYLKEKITSKTSISCMEQSPACDVIAVGFTCGSILLMNLKYDKVLFSFRQDTGPVTSLSFRTDAISDKFPFMASSSLDGRIYIWNLGRKSQRQDLDSDSEAQPEDSPQLERKLEKVMEGAHSDAIHKIQFLHGEPVLVSSSADNSLKMWIFDSPDGSARLLRGREGHWGHPTRIRYYGGVNTAAATDVADARSCDILSCGTDGTFRIFNTAVEAQNAEMSQKALLKKLNIKRRHERLPVVIGFDYSDARESEWGNVVTVHKGLSEAFVWRFRHKTATGMVLRPADSAGNAFSGFSDASLQSTAVALTPCGNYCVVGNRGGGLHLFNLQAGGHRGTFPPAAAVSTAKRSKHENDASNVRSVQRLLAAEAVGCETGALNGKRAAPAAAEAALSPSGHSQEVVGLFVDATNSVLASAGRDGLVIFWSFSSKTELRRTDLLSPAVLLQGQRDSGFVAVACQNHFVYVLDLATQRTVRLFQHGHSRAVSDLCFGPDGRRLLSSSLDGTIRVWDLTSGRCLSWLSLGAAVTSLCLSPSGEFLCLAQADKEGIYMYVDRSLYENVHYSAEPAAPTPIEDSVVQCDASPEIDAQSDDSDSEAEAEAELEAAAQPSALQPSQAPAREAERASECGAQRGEGAITLSSAPRAYWTALFNLEIIKERNRPTAAPEKPVQAPFFLPTVVRAANPSFPTPAEYRRLAEKLADKSAVTTVAEEPPLSDVAALQSKSSWSDDDGDEAGDDCADEGWEQPVQESTSRILSKRTAALPRCRLAAFLEAVTVDSRAAPAEQSTDALQDYLRSLPAPAVDVEFRALCSGAEDAEGLVLLCRLLGWLADRIASGKDFELMQAYLHRLLVVFGAMAAGLDDRPLGAALRRLLEAHEAGCGRYGDLVQRCLCLVRVLSGIAPL